MSYPPPSTGRSRFGFSLIEAAIVLGIVGLVIGGIWAAASTVNENLKVSRTVQGVLSTCAEAAKVFSRGTISSGTIEVDRTDVAIAAKIFPADWISGSSVITPYGSPAYMSEYPMGWDDPNDPSPVDSRDGTSSIYFGNLTPRLCTKIIQGMNTGSRSILRFIVVGEGSIATANDAMFTWSSLPTFAIPSATPPWSACLTSGNGGKLEINCKIGG